MFSKYSTKSQKYNHTHVLCPTNRFLSRFPLITIGAVKLYFLKFTAKTKASLTFFFICFLTLFFLDSLLTSPKLFSFSCILLKPLLVISNLFLCLLSSLCLSCPNSKICFTIIYKKTKITTPLTCPDIRCIFRSLLIQFDW